MGFGTLSFCESSLIPVISSKLKLGVGIFAERLSVRVCSGIWLLFE